MTQQVNLPAGGAVEKFEFDEAFQLKIASLIVRDTTFVQLVEGLVKPEHFDDRVLGSWVDLVLRYFEKYKRVPGDASTMSLLIKERIAARVIDNAFAGLMIHCYRDSILKADISDREFVAEQVATFARHQAFSTAILESVADLDRRDFAKIGKRLTAALDVGINQDGDIYDYSEMLKARTQERADRASGKLKPTGITTGFGQIDAALFHHGWGRKELSLIMGGAKAGKTTALVDFSLRAVEAGNNVLYVTLEVSSEIIGTRCDANISEVPVMELGQYIATVNDRVEDFMSKAGGRFIVKEFPTGTAKPSDIRRLVERFKSRGIIFDMVVVDYADIMAPERHMDDKTENSKSIYVDLRALAQREGFALLTATQTNRTGHSASVAKSEHVADDFNKIRIADIVISINKDDTERAAGQCRLFFAASRNQAGSFTIRIEQKLNCMRFLSKVIGFE